MSEKIKIKVVMSIHGLLTIVPALFLLFLYLLAFRAEALIGAWPRAGWDDPKWIGPQDPIYQFLLSSTGYCLMPLLCLTPLFWPIIFLLLYRDYSTRYKWILGLIFFLGCVAFFSDPNQLFTWWLD